MKSYLLVWKKELLIELLRSIVGWLSKIRWMSGRGCQISLKGFQKHLLTLDFPPWWLVLIIGRIRCFRVWLGLGIDMHFLKCWFILWQLLQDRLLIRKNLYKRQIVSADSGLGVYRVYKVGRVCGSFVCHVWGYLFDLI